MTVSNILRMDESLKEEGGRSIAVVGSTYSSVMGSPKEGGYDASLVKDSTLGRLELAFI